MAFGHDCFVVLLQTSNFCNIGREKAAVLPVPVCAIPSKSFPFNI